MSLWVSRRRLKTAERKGFSYPYRVRCLFALFSAVRRRHHHGSFSRLVRGREKIHGKAIEEDFFRADNEAFATRKCAAPFFPLFPICSTMFSLFLLFYSPPPILMGGGGGLYWGGGEGEKGQGFGFQKRQYSILLQHTNRSVFPTFFSGRRLGEKDRKKVPQREKKNI